MDKIRLLIVDDHSLVRQGLSQILSLEPDIEVVGEARDGEECLQKVKELHPDVTLLDINMPNMNGIKALRKLKDMDQNTKVIILTFHEEIEYLFETFNLGANGYIVKDAESDVLIHGIREVYNGVSYVYPTMAEGEASQLNMIRHVEGNGQETQKAQLTKREYEILTLIADGLNNREIANTLFISEKTVKNHVSNIFKKIKVNDRTQAAIYAYRNKIKSI
ncbi:response regulator [Anoxynatronum buryatiense]|uniref:Stage 0 sporulation protein A homolog n=1 Tax=Anoxynatronum buryatiense TaxID=489973 RepID=A0AA45WT61_9CLOT|nr:response regulator transcription factor [Anoxynatronum buryatiense]SMP39715.1 two component transcriptional regulator, LuxR family [Anoxynatronum buryatiense]